MPGGIGRNRAESKADREIAANVVRQLEKLPASADTALQAYCTGRNGTLAPGLGLIYPFGLNESQLAAVEQAFRAQVSVIEGPPGTGKTQTILNILANILLRGKTVAVLSNNNAAVENVYEKLEKRGLGRREDRCLIQAIDSRTCCQACVFLEQCWTAEEQAALPCGH